MKEEAHSVGRQVNSEAAKENRARIAKMHSQKDAQSA